MSQSNVYRLPCRHHIRLQHLDGREWVRETFLRVEDAWAWVANTVAAALEVDPDAVDCFESAEGDMVTIDGIPVCWVVHGLPH